MAGVTRFDRSAITGAVLVVDLAIIAAQLSYGLVLHGTDPLSVPIHTAETLFPFLLAWLLLAPMLGVYTARVRRSMTETVLAVTIAWIAAALLGVGLRATPWLTGGAPLTFILVTIGTGLLTLLPWRLLVSALARNNN
jgi:hypothetical protein